MGEFEKACVQAEYAAAAAIKAAGALARAAKQLEKAAQDGDVAKIRKATEAVRIAEQVSRQDARNAQLAWPFTPDQEESLLRQEYERELCDMARERGLKITSLDNRLIVYPSVLRVLPESRAVQVDRKKVTALRPSKVVDHLQANQSKKPRFKPEQFIESLHGAYKLVVGPQGVQGTTLANVYRALTLLPGSNRDYDKSDFARDVFFLQSSNVAVTKGGSRVSFPASTGTKGSSDLFTFVEPDGTPVVYYGIAFSEPRS